MLATILTIATVILSPFHSHNNPYNIAHHVKNHPVHRVHHSHLRELPPMEAVAHLHKWSPAQVADAWRILYMESGSTPEHVNLYAENHSSGCVGSAQFLSWRQYYTFGGNPNTVRGQLLAFGNYIKERYGDDPAQALQFHYEHGWY